MLRREWQIGVDARTIAAGRKRSFFVDAHGALLACDKEEEGEIGLLGLQAGTSQIPLRRWCQSPCRPWREFASGLWFATTIATSP
jgi:hypothetical protein